MDDLLKVNHLKTAFTIEGNEVIPVDDVSFDLKKGETIGIVGESGCGKSVTSFSLMRLLGKNGKIKSGEVIFEGEDIAKKSEKEMHELRGNKMSMIFQEPMTSLNPLFTIGNQMMEAIMLHLKMDKKDAREYAIKMLKEVGIPRAEEIIDDYPHTLSGGMRQRVMIAMALSCKPKLLIADEPTTALDVTIQAQILELIKKLRENYGMSVMLITHDLGVISEMADKVMVMYAGQVVEETDVFTLFDNPEHPYTLALMNSIPQIDDTDDKELQSIPGVVPSLSKMVSGCRFHTRCSKATERCKLEVPELKKIKDGHFVRCFLVEDKMKKSGEANE
ncbi:MULTISPECIES: ABC transporter ATP-binding protein [Clostridium]|uniref:ABC transporter ATP-binding protein n=1 Tax=Clostridium TaxID=1485 RepID=UPI00069CE60B|nr:MULTISPECIES: ABC transporter ATP-binding protein [Clostridium]KOF57154.1 peptide ABC transporter ATP-binding protein [Clostridium sp. DMHC 10]MCD2345648.1 ABC transporter ATP-binding protein [Clostridium guangxiense]